MPTIIDVEGEREVTEEELRRLDEEADWAWTAFWDALPWRPVDGYDRASAPTVLLRLGKDWALGYWGSAEEHPSEAWHHAQDWREGDPVELAPALFAVPSDEMVERLTAD